jgi:hypothetical protein
LRKLVPIVVKLTMPLRQVTEAQLATQAPEHHEGDDVAGILGPVQQAGAALIELLAAGATAEPAIALSGKLGPLLNGR